MRITVKSKWINQYKIRNYEKKKQMIIKCDTKWGFQKLYDFGVSVCREQNKKTEEKLN